MSVENIAKVYFNGLKKAYIENGAKKEWDAFENVIHGATEEDFASLKKLYPGIPDSLIELLKIMDGTYYRDYEGKKVSFFLLGSE